MKSFVFPLLAASLSFASCGNNDADNDTGTDTTLAAPADRLGAGSMEFDSNGADMNNMDGMGTGGSTNAAGGSTSGGTGSNTPASNMDNRGGADNSGTGISGGQGTNAAGTRPPSNNASGNNTGGGNTGAQRQSNRAPYPVDGISTADGAAPTSTRANRDNITNDSLNNRSGLGTSR